MSNINSIMGADDCPVPDSVGNKTRYHTYPFSLSLTCKAISFNYKRGCTLSSLDDGLLALDVLSALKRKEA